VEKPRKKIENGGLQQKYLKRCEKMQVRKLSVEEHGKTRKMYEEIFPEDSQAFVDYYYTEKTKDNQIYVVEEDGDMRAMLHLNPYQVMVNRENQRLHYIVAVATQVAYRKRGYMAALLKQALQDMQQAGEIFTYLMPAAESIYLPHDFRTVYEQQIPYVVEATADQAVAPENHAGEATADQAVAPENHAGETMADQTVTQEKLLDEDCQELSVWANARLSERYQVYTVRDAAYYQRAIQEYGSDGGKLIVYRNGQEIVDCKYALPDAESPAPAKIMVRIVDVRRMLMALRLKTLMAACFTVTDPLMEENNRCFTITGTEFSGVLLMDGRPENSEGTITIAALGSLLFGAKSVEEICEEDGVTMTERLKTELKKLVPLRKIYLNEIV
jgi:predicted acetyltransferase